MTDNIDSTDPHKYYYFLPEEYDERLMKALEEMHKKIDRIETILSDPGDEVDHIKNNKLPDDYKMD